MNELFLHRLVRFVASKPDLREIFGSHVTGDQLVLELLKLNRGCEEAAFETLQTLVADYKYRSPRWKSVRKGAVGGMPCRSLLEVERVSRKADEKRLVILGWHDADGGLGCECCLCGVALDPDEVTVDHAVPKDQHGGEHLSNLLPMCPDCNFEKGNQTVREFLVAKGLSDEEVAGIESEIHEGVELRQRAAAPWVGRLSEHQKDRLAVTHS